MSVAYLQSRKRDLGDCNRKLGRVKSSWRSEDQNKSSEEPENSHAHECMNGKQTMQWYVENLSA
jgi:hypothetical protein